jgi:hypothetical protein
VGFALAPYFVVVCANASFEDNPFSACYHHAWMEWSIFNQKHDSTKTGEARK